MRGVEDRSCARFRCLTRPWGKPLRQTIRDRMNITKYLTFLITSQTTSLSTTYIPPSARITTYPHIYLREPPGLSWIDLHFLSLSLSLPSTIPIPSLSISLLQDSRTFAISKTRETLGKCEFRRKLRRCEVSSSVSEV